MIKKTFICFGLILFLFAKPSLSASRENVSLIYFFSATCPHCKQATPVVSRLSRDYEVQGLLFGTEPAGQLPFPVRKGTKEEGDRFGIQGIPSLVVLSKETVKYIFVGDRSINDAPLLLRAFQDGALTVSELLKQNPSGDVTVAGWVLAHGDYFSDNSQFILSDRQKNIRVQPWLPREAAKSRLKQTRPRLMSDVVGKPVVLTGRLVTGEGAPRFQVKGEKRVE